MNKDNDCPLVNTRIAILGDFAGIQSFVLRPVPGVGGAGRRLRARSFRVLILTRLVAEEVLSRFSDCKAELLYCAGGRFMVLAQFCTDSNDRVLKLQRELDNWLLTEFNGELQFHLASSAMESSLPSERLRDDMRLARQQPFKSVLAIDGQWHSERFFSPADDKWTRCKGCSCTAQLYSSTELKEDQEELCRFCAQDSELGKKMPSFNCPGVKQSSDGSLRFVDKLYSIGSNFQTPIQAIDYVPQISGRVMTFEDLAERSRGRSWLGYLRMDADHIGEAFRNLSDDLDKVRSLSLLLNQYFTSGLQALITNTFRDVYPVYSGGDDLFMIGPWNVMVDFALAVAESFHQASSGKLSITGGLALAKPRQHILTMSQEAQEALDIAKERRSCFRVLGQTLDWPKLKSALACAKELADLYEQKAISSALIHTALLLHQRWMDVELRDYSYRSKMYYFIERNAQSKAKFRLRNIFLESEEYWNAMGFILRYVILTKPSNNGEGNA